MKLLIEITNGELGLLLGMILVGWIGYRLFDNIFYAMRKDLKKLN